MSSTRSIESYRGHLYHSAELQGHPLVTSILEVNWDDVSPPGRTVTQQLTHFMAILASSLRVAVSQLRPSSKGPHWAGLFRWVFNTLLVWCVYLPIVTIGSFAEGRSAQTAWIVTTVVWLIAVTKILERYEEQFRAGAAWALITALVGVVSMMSSELRDIGVWFATAIYGTVQGLAGLGLVGSMVVAWRQSVALRPEQRSARLALLYLPFAVISGIGAVVWAAALALASVVLSSEQLEAWSAAYVSHLNYDLAFSETLLAVAIGLGGLGLMWPVYPLMRDNRSAELIHARVATALKGFAWVVVAVLALYVAHLPLFIAGGPHAAFDMLIQPLVGGARANGGTDVFEVYRLSALRLLPFLPYLFGPLRVVLDVTGDVLLFIDRDGKLARDPVRDASIERLRDALALSSQADDQPVIVVAHSQGTAIAAEVLASGRAAGHVFLVTLGSPIASLYWRFLGHESVAVPPVRWLNLFRTGDYIAGGVGVRAPWAPASRAEDWCLGEGRHAAYFEDPNVWRVVCQWFDDARPPLPATSADRR